MESEKFAWSFLRFNAFCNKMKKCPAMEIISIRNVMAYNDYNSFRLDFANTTQNLQISSP